MSTWEYSGMANIKEYIIIEEQTLDNMNLCLDHLVKQGYRPHGSVSYKDGDILQGMILYEEESLGGRL